MKGRGKEMGGRAPAPPPRNKFLVTYGLDGMRCWLRLMVVGRVISRTEILVIGPHTVNVQCLTSRHDVLNTSILCMSVASDVHVSKRCTAVDGTSPALARDALHIAPRDSVL